MLAVVGGAFGIAVAFAGTRLILYLAFEMGGPNNYVPVIPRPRGRCCCSPWASPF